MNSDVTLESLQPAEALITDLTLEPLIFDVNVSVMLQHITQLKESLSDQIQQILKNIIW